MLCGERGIRTPGTVIPYVSLANWWFQPLTHLTKLPFGMARTAGRPIGNANIQLFYCSAIFLLFFDLFFYGFKLNLAYSEGFGKGFQVFGSGFFGVRADDIDHPS